tara:strand:+ start:243 stop:470 length:228 start_codon:yes stop_codon:yes gene_type:complete
LPKAKYIIVNRTTIFYNYIGVLEPDKLGGGSYDTKKYLLTHAKCLPQIVIKAGRHKSLKINDVLIISDLSKAAIL